MGKLIKNWSLIKRLWLVTFSIITTVSVILSAISIENHIESEKHKFEENVEILMFTTKHEILPNILSGDYESIKQILVHKNKLYSIDSIEWVDVYGNIVKSENKNEEQVVPYFFASAIEKYISLNLYHYDDINVGDVDYGMLKIKFNNLEIVKSVAQEILYKTLFTISCLIGLLLGINLTARRTLNIFYKFLDGTERVCKGDLTVRLEQIENGCPEVVKGIDAFNKMVNNIEMLFNDVKKQKSKNELLATIVKYSEEAIYTLDKNGIITSWNKGAEKLFGYTETEMIGLSEKVIYVDCGCKKYARCQKTNHYDECLECPEYIADYDIFNDVEARIKSEKPHLGKEIVRRTKNNSIIEVMISSAPIYDDEGNHIGELSMNIDITDKKKNENLIHAEKERLNKILESINEMVIAVNIRGDIEYVNESAEKAFGILGEQQTSIFNYLSLEYVSSRSKVPNLVNLCIQKNHKIDIIDELMLKDKDNKKMNVDISILPIYDIYHKIVNLVFVIKDTTKIKRTEFLLDWWTAHDQLTGLINRYEFEKKLLMLINAAKMNHAEYFILYMDIDRFVIINDMCGHDGGDELLRQTSLILSKIFKHHVIGRLGGDSFGVILENISLDDSRKSACDLLNAIREYKFEWNDIKYDITASICVITINENTDNLASIINRSFTACASIKENGGDDIKICHPSEIDEDLERTQKEIKWIPKILKALDNNEFKLFYQPIVPLKNNENDEHKYVEIFVRLMHDNKIILPGEFIPAAEKYNIMTKIDRWVIERLFSEYKTSFDPATIYAINISNSSINDPTFLQFVTSMFDLYPSVKMESICFEIDETSLIKDFERTKIFIQNLKEIGCKFLLDSFGNNLLSFTYLKDLPIDYIKIEGSYIKDILNDSSNSIMIDAVNKMSDNLGVKAIAEFIEDVETMEKLESIGIKYGQGYFISKPEEMKGKK